MEEEARSKRSVEEENRNWSQKYLKKTGTTRQKLAPQLVNYSAHLEIDNAPEQCLTSRPSIMSKLVSQRGGDYSLVACGLVKLSI